MDEMVDWIRPVHFNGCNGVGHGEQFRYVTLYELVYVRDVSDHKRSLSQPDARKDHVTHSTDPASDAVYAECK